MTTAGSMLDEMQALERSLLHTDFRDKPRQLQALLADEFREVTADGNVASRQQVIDWLLNKDPAARWDFNEMSVSEPGLHVRLLHYRAKQVLPQSSPGKGSRYCSVWKFNPQTQSWQLAFHQATRLN